MSPQSPPALPQSDPATAATPAVCPDTASATPLPFSGAGEGEVPAGCAPGKISGMAGRHWSGAFAASTVMHLSLIVMLGYLWTAQAPSAVIPLVETRWEPSDEPEELLRIAPTISPTSANDHSDGGRTVGGLMATATNSTPLTVSPTTTRTPSLLALLESLSKPDGLRESVEPLVPAAGDPGGAGDGNGEGTGDGDGRGTFFNFATSGRRFVFVVDRSKSMNHPHPSEAKTRFRRLKLELVKSITALDESSSFFVIFFNHEALPMPAYNLQAATPHAQQKYLRWVAEVKADGDTDPRTALQLAMRLAPDVVYFLTDGSFDKRIERDLLKLNQRKIKVHTFAFGNREAEEMLRKIAQQNAGSYTFVP